MHNKIREYEIYLREQELTEETIKIYMRHAKQIQEYVNEAGLSKQTILDYKNKLKDRNIAPSTFNLAIISVNKYLKFIGCKDYTVKMQKIQKRNSLENVLAIEDYRKMLAVAKDGRRKKYYYIMRSLALTGIRVSELRYFTVESLGRKKISVNNKGKLREIYLPDRLIYELEIYCKKAKIKSGVIFKGNTDKPIGRASVYKMLARIGEDAGISKEKVYPHSFRHLFAVTYMNCYGNLTELADILGHSNLETTRIYTQSTAEEKRKRMNDMDL